MKVRYMDIFIAAFEFAMRMKAKSMLEFNTEIYIR